MTTANDETLVRAEAPLSPQEQEQAQLRLWEFLGRRVRRYTMGESQSLPAETARELLESALLLFQMAGASQRDLLCADLDALFAAGLRRAEAQISRGRQLWRAACAGLPGYGSRPMRETLRSIGRGFDRYDYRYFARDFPCEIDYQLCRPAPEEPAGILFINEYLRRIAAENSLLRGFDRNAAVRLLERFCPTYRGELLNLCEPLLLCAAGRALCGGEPSALTVTEAQRARLEKRFAPMTRAQAGEALAQGARAVCRAFGIADGFTRDYAAQTAADAAPRLLAAVAAGKLENLFPALR